MNTDKNSSDLNPSVHRKYTESERKEILKRAAENLISSIKSFHNFCKIYHDAITVDPTMKEDFRLEHPTIPEAGWVRIYEVGAGTISPLLGLNFPPSSNMLVRLPLTEQDRAMTSPIDVVIINSSGEYDKVKIEFRNMTIEQKKQVIAYDHIRNDSEQRAYLENVKTNSMLKVKQSRPAYTINKSELIVNEPCKITKNALLEILKDMK